MLEILVSVQVLSTYLNGFEETPNKIRKNLIRIHDIIHLEKKNFIISGLKKYTFVRQKIYSGDLIDHRVATDRHLCFALDTEAKDF